MSQPNEPRFEDDFDCDTEPADQYYRGKTTLEDIAITKSHAYANARAPNNVRLYGDMKDAYKEGFLQGFAHRMGGGHGG